MQIEANNYVHTTPFWDGVEKRQLFLQYCNDTEQFQHPPRPVSVYTGRQNLSWRPVSGGGMIYASAVLYAPGASPSCVATVQLDEGVHIVTKILDAETIAIGARVQLAWHVLEGGQLYPAFCIA